MNAKFVIALAVVVASQVTPSLAEDSQPDFDQLVDRAIFQENALLKILRGERPIAETYIQDMEPDTDFGAVPRTDHYFLGKLDLSRGVNTGSLLPQSSTKTRAFEVFTRLFSTKYLPRGFAQMILIDGGQFDRAHYDFEFVKREFLGDVRTVVINVAPKKNAGSGRFIGRMWVEDRDFNVVRFNGTYSKPRDGEFYMHFDSWRVNCGPALWVPFESYSEESALPYALGMRKLRVKGVTRIWGYTTATDRSAGEFTNLTVDLPSVKDSSDQAADNSPVESVRAWEQQAQDNIVGRLEKANLMAPAGDVEKVLDTVVNNLMVTNNLDIVPEAHVRVLLTMPLETFGVGHTIVISRGLLDTLPDEASLAAILCHELAHIVLGQETDTKFAFSDRVNFSDEETLRKFRFARTQADEDAANAKALEFLQKSPYSDKLNQAGLFLKALAAESEQLPNLIKPLFGSRMAAGNNVLRLSALLQRAPELQRTRVDQIAALPLGTRTSLDPWTDRLRLTKLRQVPLLSDREKLPFEIAPIYLRLRYESAPDAQVLEGSLPKPQESPAAVSRP